MKTKTLLLAASVLATSLVAMGGDIDWKSTIVIAERKRDKNDLAEEEAIMDLYKAALGMSHRLTNVAALQKSGHWLPSSLR